MSWDSYFMSIVHTVATRSKCLRAKLGAIAVLDRRIIATGYNWTPSGVTHCADRGGCWRDINNIPSGGVIGECPSIHAEMNLVTQAALHGVSLKGSTVYCSKQPCPTCAGLLINSGVQKIIYDQEYPNKLCDALCLEAGVSLIRYNSNRGVV